jgi:hypothetical protein
MEAIVPLASPVVKGPLGVAHLPRLWLKAILAETGALPDGYRSGYAGTDKVLLDGIRLDPADAFAYLKTGPAYMVFEAWVREHAARLDAVAIEATNVTIGAPLADAFDDWNSVHAAVVARRGSKMQPIVPAVSSQSIGPLGLMHLPRFWMKATLNGAGVLYEEWRSGLNSPFDVWFCGVIGLDLDAAIAYIHAELPPYAAFEAWAVAHAKHLSAAEVTAHNAAMRVREKPEEVAVRERAFLGMDAPGYRPSVELNDLVDWHTIYVTAYPDAVSVV